MGEETTLSPLAYNLRFLRKKHKMSQTALAESLGIRRSNVAAYESKNVEPRLRILLQIGDYFNIAIRTLIEERLDDTSYDKALHTKTKSQSNPINLDSQLELDDFIEKSEKIHKVLEGFKAFYRFKKERLIKEEEGDVESVMHDIENFIGLMEHLLNYNASIIKTLQHAPDDNSAEGIDGFSEPNGR